MSDKTKIQYCDSTCNPTMGCDGCELWNSGRHTCYAGIQHNKFGPYRRGYSPTFEKITYWSGRMAETAKLSDLRGQSREVKPWLDGWPRLVFISDMGDALCEEVPFAYLRTEIIYNVTSPHGRWHRWLWLTKRPHRMAKFSAWLEDSGFDWPANLWAGTSVTAAKTTGRIDHLLKVGNEDTIRYVSVEPQWEPVDLRPWLPKLDWIIQGGESGGSQAKRFQLEWAREMRQHCAEAGVPYFLKQLGCNAFDGEQQVDLNDNHGGAWDEWPTDLRVREIPTSAAPMKLDSPAPKRAWGNKKVNIVLGCPNRCRYCYARSEAKRRGRIGKFRAWGTTYLRLNKTRFDKGWHNHGTIRFPATHDITPEFLEECITVIRNLLAGGNRVIVCSKPRLDCIQRLCQEFADARSRIEFRFTIGAIDDDILRFWEPGAPGFRERLDCLKHASRKGFDTSVNIEPMLDAPNVSKLFRRVAPYVNVFTNIGIMERIPWNVKPRSEEVEAAVCRIEENQAEDRLRAIYEELKDEALVRWSPETREILGLAKAEQCGQEVGRLLVR